MRALTILIALLIYTIPSFCEEDITLTTPTGNIYGKIFLPEENLPCPLVVIIAGSGPTDMNGNTIGSDYNNNSLLYLAQELAKNGIATLRYDKRGIGKSAEAANKEEDIRFEHYINDVILWTELLAKDNRFTQITIAGHSEGSLIGMIACNKNINVKSFISISGSGSPAYTLIEEQLGRQSQSLRAEAAKINKELCNGRSVKNIPTTLTSLYRKSVQPYLISWFRYDPAREIAKLEIPVLILQGDKDLQVSTRESQKLYLARMLSSYYIIENMNHVLKHCDSDNMIVQMPTYISPDFPIKKELIERIVCFVKQ
ncbi:MAG: alpha/beta hydrolase [Bacteroidaceae bacterium]|nr:alpha/beta hydrolase [Bacteroidaceae bacterium]